MKTSVLILVLFTVYSNMVLARNMGISSCKKDDFTSERIIEAIGPISKHNENEFKTFLWLRNAALHRVGVFTFSTDQNGKFLQSGAVFLCGDTSNYNYNDLDLKQLYFNVKAEGVDGGYAVSIGGFDNSPIYQDEAMAAIQGVATMAQKKYRTKAEITLGGEVAVLNLLIGVFQMGQMNQEADPRNGLKSITSFGRFQLRLPGILFE